jgi:hypothetical protein
VLWLTGRVAAAVRQRHYGSVLRQVRDAAKRALPLRIVWAGVCRHAAAPQREWELPVLGAVTAPTAVLIRPDGYVAWVGDRTHLGLPEALTTWFGPPTAA